MKILVTGNAGFIGFHTAKLLLERGNSVVGYDNVNDYYDTRLKEARLQILQDTAQQSGAEYTFYRHDIADQQAVEQCFVEHRFDCIIHLAAQAGVRYSLENPRAYIDSNVIGTFNIMEGARQQKVKHLLMASTSSIYGANDTMPYAETHKADTQMSFYAATKKANEAMAHAYAHLHGVPTTMFRFFTVYGPWGRPDMALFKFTKNILEGKPIDIYNHGQMWRDFTYVEDLARGILLLLETAPPAPGESRPSAIEGDSLSPVAPYRIINIGNSDKVRLLDFVEAIEAHIGQKAKRNYMDMQPGDVPATWADASLLQRLTGYRPETSFRQGVGRFVDWYRGFYNQ